MMSMAVVAQNNENAIDTRPMNGISFNLLGDASLISVHYDRLILLGPSFMLSGKLGVGYNEEFQLCIFGPCSSPPGKYMSIPHHITGNLGKRKHFFEFGLGGTLILGNTVQPYVLYPMLGYRFLPLRSGKINFRIFGQVPLSRIEDILFVPFGISLGISF